MRPEARQRRSFAYMTFRSSADTFLTFLSFCVISVRRDRPDRIPRSTFLDLATMAAGSASVAVSSSIQSGDPHENVPLARRRSTVLDRPRRTRHRRRCRRREPVAAVTDKPDGPDEEEDQEEDQFGR